MEDELALTIYVDLILHQMLEGGREGMTPVCYSDGHTRLVHQEYNMPRRACVCRCDSDWSRRMDALPMY